MPNTTEQDLLALKLAGFLEININGADKFGDQYYVLTKDGFNHLVGLRTYQMAKKTRELTNWIIWLTIVMIGLGLIQIWKLFF